MPRPEQSYFLPVNERDSGKILGFEGLKEPYRVGDLVQHRTCPGHIYKVTEARISPRNGSLAIKISYVMSTDKALGTPIPDVEWWNARNFWRWKSPLELQYPHECPYCKSAAYVGFSSLECSAGCAGRKR